MIALGRHYGCKVEPCVPYDPESKGGVEATPEPVRQRPDPLSAYRVTHVCTLCRDTPNPRYQQPRISTLPG